MQQLSAYAIIKDNKVVNIIVGTYPDCNDVAHITYGNEAFAEEIWSMYYPAGRQIPTVIGDDYIDGVFYHNGEAVTPIPTVDAQTVANTNSINNNSASIDNLWVAVLEG